MKKKISVVVMMALLLNCAYPLRHYRGYERTRPIIISTRVGETIDLEEREKYGLFRLIPGFKAATFYAIHGGGFEVEIITENKKLVAVNRDSLAIALLMDYIDRYDEIERAEFEEKWKIVDYDYLGQPITQHEVDRVKQGTSCIGCAVGCGVLGFYPSIVLAMLTDYATGGNVWGKGGNELASIGIFIAAMGASILTGALIGKKMYRYNALKAIKEARKPEIVERF